MPTTEIGLWVTATVALLGAVWAIVRDRRKPQLDAAQAENTLVNSDAVKAEIKRQSDESNLRRDLRVLDLENWAWEKVRPWGRHVVVTFEKMCDLMREDRTALGLEMPEIHLDEFPEMPPPRPLTPT